MSRSIEELERCGAHEELGVALIQRLSAEPSLELFKRAVSSLLLANHPEVVLQLLSNIINQSPEVATELSPYHYFALVLSGQDSRAEMVLHTLGAHEWARGCLAKPSTEFRLLLVAQDAHRAVRCSTAGRSGDAVVVTAHCPRCGGAVHLRMAQLLLTTFIPCAACAFPYFLLPGDLAPLWPLPLTPRERRVLEAFGGV